MCTSLLTLRRAVGDAVERDRTAWHRVVRARDPVALIDTRAFVNRAYVKFLEVSSVLNMTPQRVGLLAEAPGGFLQATGHIWPQCEAIATSLQTEDSIPFRPDLCAKVLRVSGSGDLRDHAQAREVVKAIGANSCDLVTADGGTEATDFDDAEAASLRLLLAEAVTAIRLQRPGGALVLKAFEGSLSVTRDLFALLLTLYNDCHLSKPLSSRAGNSERYLIAVGFRGDEAVAAKATESIDRCIDQLEAAERDGNLSEVASGIRLTPSRPRGVDNAFETVISKQAAELQRLLSALDEGNDSALKEARGRETEHLVAMFQLPRFVPKGRSLPKKN